MLPIPTMSLQDRPERTSWRGWQNPRLRFWRRHGRRGRRIFPLESQEQALILASIIEKETGLANEREIVSSVFVNRLKKGMRLQTDPTVIYGVTEGKGNLGRGLRQSELKRETPYNTYIIRGLPPTPISNPGRLAIRAALHPAETSFLYFVADGNGGHRFATNLREHTLNVQQMAENRTESTVGILLRDRNSSQPLSHSRLLGNHAISKGVPFALLGISGKWIWNCRSVNVDPIR